MDQMIIRGGNPLNGKIHISGAKNAALPLLTASLLTDEVLTLGNVPQLADIATMGNLLGQHGASLGLNAGKGGGHTVQLHAKNITNTTAPYDLVRKMRASILVLGPLVARCREAKISLPGGCAIGTRPVDLHIAALEKMGAIITIEDGYINAAAPQGLKGAEITFPMVTVTGTENILMAATLAKGETVLNNAAREPEIGDLAECLVKMGAQIEGIGTDCLRIQGKDRLHGARHDVIADRIEAGTFAMAAAITNGDMELLGARMDGLKSVFDVLAKAGVMAEETADGIRVRRAKDKLIGVDVM
ncbi:MAG TPA: UDP-N-acetylglucosamine 1-carboxyvinyltransferase, partial [Rhodospirillaceae bacterium]|nr:UDP-N-acetylglucosamine 1-carboxyvinyltransferase [Rhodospirillaceae bacterium]